MKNIAKATIQKKVLVVILLVGIGGILWVQRVDSSTPQQVSTSTADPVEQYALTATTTLPFLVSGVITATDAVVVRAQANGPIESILVTEGSVVSTAQLLSKINAPVLAGNIALGRAQGELTKLNDMSQVAYKNDTAVRSSLSTDTTEVRGALGVSAREEQLRGAASSAVLKLEEVSLQLLTVLDFIDSHRSYFNADALATHRSIIHGLYTDQPSYLGNGILYPSTPEGTILRQLDELKNSQDISISKLLTLSTQLDDQLTSLQVALTAAEDTFLNERKVETSGELYATYLEHRARIVSTQNTLRTVTTSLQNTFDSVGITSQANSTDNELARRDQETALTQANYAKEIANQSSVVADSQLDVLYREQSLTENKAPFSGIISKVFVDRGSYVQRNDPLFILTGNGAIELVVRIPSKLLSLLEVGQVFMVQGTPVGHVSRFSPTAQAGSIEVFIDLNNTEYLIGEVLVGELQLSSHTSVVHEIPRTYIHFTTEGPHIRELGGSEIPVTILYDNGTKLYVELDRPVKYALLPTQSTQP